MKRLVLLTLSHGVFKIWSFGVMRNSLARSQTRLLTTRIYFPPGLSRRKRNASYRFSTDLLNQVIDDATIKNELIEVLSSKLW